MTKQARYYFDYQAIKEPAKTKPHAPGWKKTPMTPDGPMRTRGPAFADRIFGADGKRMKRDVWSVPIYQFKGAHFATFPPKLITPCVLAGCPAGGVVLDCFSGSATTGLVALQHGRRYVGIELNPEYNDIARQRLNSFSSSTLIDS
jgi:site-specific DNA-methyltransferase (adenine-specific)